MTVIINSILPYYMRYYKLFKTFPNDVGWQQKELKCPEMFFVKTLNRANISKNILKNPFQKIFLDMKLCWEKFSQLLLLNFIKQINERLFKLATAFYALQIFCSILEIVDEVKYYG